MIIVDSVFRAMEVAEAAHKNQKYSGKSYFTHHVLPVANEANDLLGSIIHRKGHLPIFDALYIVGILHDVFEDSDHVLNKTIGFKEDQLCRDMMIEVLDLLTLKSEYSYRENIQRLCDSGNAFAICTKLADNLVNSNPKNLRGVKNSWERRSKKYQDARRQLEPAYMKLTERNLKL